MKPLLAVALLVALTHTAALAAPEERIRRADRDAVISLLRREGIVAQNARVIDISWAGEFWIATVRHADGRKTDWRVDAMARDYSYICQH